jgi:hypothetical protein
MRRVISAALLPLLISGCAQPAETESKEAKDTIVMGGTQPITLSGNGAAFVSTIKVDQCWYVLVTTTYSTTMTPLNEPVAGVTGVTRQQVCS